MNSGCGKTTLVEYFSEYLGIEVLQEAFLDQTPTPLHPQTLTNELVWLSCWAQNAFKVKDKLSQTATTRTLPLPDRSGVDSHRTLLASRAWRALLQHHGPLVIADRSPYSAAFYARQGRQPLCDLVPFVLDELGNQAGIHVFTVYLRVCSLLMVSRAKFPPFPPPQRRSWLFSLSSHVISRTAFAPTFPWVPLVPFLRGLCPLHGEGLGDLQTWSRFGIGYWVTGDTPLAVVPSSRVVGVNFPPCPSSIENQVTVFPATTPLLLPRSTLSLQPSALDPLSHLPCLPSTRNGRVCTSTYTHTFNSPSAPSISPHAQSRLDLRISSSPFPFSFSGLVLFKPFPLPITFFLNACSWVLLYFFSILSFTDPNGYEFLFLPYTGPA